jgi:hypothetical protein
MDDVPPESDPLRSAFTAEIEELTEQIRELNARIEAGEAGKGRRSSYRAVRPLMTTRTSVP